MREQYERSKERLNGLCERLTMERMGLQGRNHANPSGPTLDAYTWRPVRRNSQNLILGRIGNRRLSKKVSFVDIDAKKLEAEVRPFPGKFWFARLKRNDFLNHMRAPSCPGGGLQGFRSYTGGILGASAGYWRPRVGAAQIA